LGIKKGGKGKGKVKVEVKVEVDASTVRQTHCFAAQHKG
jgi:hypothetical protein